MKAAATRMRPRNALTPQTVPVPGVWKREIKLVDGTSFFVTRLQFPLILRALEEGQPKIGITVGMTAYRFSAAEIDSIRLVREELTEEAIANG